MTTETREQKKKRQKKVEQRRKYEKTRNLSWNKKEPVFIMSVQRDGEWIFGAKGFPNRLRVDKYLAKVEEARKVGKTILSARIYEVKTGKLVEEVQGTEIPVEPKDLSDGMQDVLQTKTLPDVLESVKSVPEEKKD